jgi:Flp pilus assembly protein TadG
MRSTTRCVGLTQHSTLKTQNSGRKAGAAAAELAVALPLLALVVLGCVDFGRFCYHHIALTNAARAGAAYGIMHNYPAAEQAAWEAQIQEVARDEMTQQTGYVRASLTTTTTVTVEQSGLRRVRVQANHPFQTIVAWPSLPAGMTLRSAIEMRAIR